MKDCDKLLAKAKRAPNNLAFDDICELAECFGWVFRRQSGSHKIYENAKLVPGEGRFQNFQSVKGRAKPYQVRQLLKAIEVLNG